MLPFDSTRIRWPKHSILFTPTTIPRKWFVKDYSRFFTGVSDDSGSYIPDPHDMDYDGPVRWEFDIYSTPWLA